MPQQYADMFVGNDRRPPPPGQADELTTLREFLRWQRRTLELKCEGLSAAQLAARPLAPSLISLIGLVRHLADVERGWFRRGLAGQDAPDRYGTDDEPDRDFTGATADPEAIEEAWAAWRDEVAFTDRFLAGASYPQPSVPNHFSDRDPLSLRWVLVHLIEEYARHNGHADILREQLDGRVGQ